MLYNHLMAKKNIVRANVFVLTPALRKAITQVYNDGEQNWDRGEGWPPDDPKIKKQYEMVLQLTEYSANSPNEELQ